MHDLYTRFMKYINRTEQSYSHLKQRVETIHPQGSRERACYKAILSSGLDLHNQMALFCLLVNENMQEAASLLAIVKAAHTDTVREIVTALNNFPPACRGTFHDVFEGKGFLFIDRTQKWHTPRREFQPGLINNPQDKKKLAAALKYLPEENKDIFMAAYQDFVIGRGTTNRTDGVTYLSYNELCYVSGFLLEPGERRDELLGLNERHRVISVHHNRLVAANNFIQDYCRAQNITAPYTDFGKYVGGQSVDRAVPAAIEKNRSKGPGLALINFSQAVETDNKKISNGSLRGKAGFDLQGAQEHLVALIDKKRIKPSDRDLFNQLARQDGPDVYDVADEKKQAPLAIAREYMAVARALQLMLPKNTRIPVVTVSQKLDWD